MGMILVGQKEVKKMCKWKTISRQGEIKLCSQVARCGGGKNSFLETGRMEGGNGGGKMSSISSVCVLSMIK